MISGNDFTFILSSAFHVEILYRRYGELVPVWLGIKLMMAARFLDAFTGHYNGQIVDQ